MSLGNFTNIATVDARTNTSIIDMIKVIDLPASISLGSVDRGILLRSILIIVDDPVEIYGGLHLPMTLSAVIKIGGNVLYGCENIILTELGSTEYPVNQIFSGPGEITLELSDTAQLAYSGHVYIIAYLERIYT